VIGGLTHFLKNDSDKPFIFITLSNGERDTLPLFVNPEDHKLTRPVFLRHFRSLNPKLRDSGMPFLLRYNVEHGSLLS
jgi:hypothetical protein